MTTAGHHGAPARAPASCHPALPPTHLLPTQVFNKAGAREYNGQVPDTWAVLNASDPVPWIPKARASSSHGRCGGLQHARLAAAAGWLAGWLATRGRRGASAALPPRADPPRRCNHTRLPATAHPPPPPAPQWGFKRVGKRVNIDARGNLVLRPS